MNNFIREPINGLTHLAGAILSLIALIAMIVKVALDNPTVIGLIAVTIFGVSMILLYATSATYHMVISSDTAVSYTHLDVYKRQRYGSWILFNHVRWFSLCNRREHR